MLGTKIVMSGIMDVDIVINDRLIACLTIYVLNHLKKTNKKIFRHVPSFIDT